MSATDKFLLETTDYSSEDARFMKMAIDLSYDNIDSGGGPFGAVIVKVWFRVIVLMMITRMQ